MTDLTGRVALVTGASRGIGAETARRLAASGAKVALTARSLEEIQAVSEQIRAAGGDAISLRCDVSDFGAVSAAVAETIDQFGRLDILVNNAGVIDPIAEIGEGDPAQWGRAVDVNVKGVYHGIRAALPDMLTAGGGTIINISSGAATEVFEGWSSYCASKAAVLALTRVVNEEYRDRGIRIVGLVPGTVATDMQAAIRASGINRVSRRSVNDHFPVSWPAETVVWLCGNGANDYLGEDFSIKDPENRSLVGLA